MPLPHIPDEAFEAAYTKYTTWRNVRRVDAPVSDEDLQRIATEATDGLLQSVGLSGEFDVRAYALAQSMLGTQARKRAELEPVVVGIALGLMIAEATGWEPPLSDH